MSNVSWPQQWFDLPLAVFDLETTGFDSSTCQIIEIGIVLFERGEVTQTLDWLIDPECEIPAEIVKLTHIEQSDVNGQPKFRDLAQTILDTFKGRGIVAYNIGFDRPFLTHKLEELGLSWPNDNPTIDPLVFAQHFYPHSRSNNLGAVAEKLGISLEGAHRAFNDAEATGKVLYAFRDKLPPDLEALLITQAQWQRENEERNRWMKGNRTSGGLGLNALSQEQSNKLGPAFFYGTEPDPLRALYSLVPNAARNA